MRPAFGRWSAVWFAAAWAAPAHAQGPATPPDAPRERAGPEAQPPPVPAWPKPEAAPALPAPAAPSASTPPEIGDRQIRQVAVTVEGPGLGGVPPRRWRPPEGVGGLRLEHRPGEALNAGWIRRQFALNGFDGARGGSLSAAVALVQLLNRAFVTAGFVNTGLLVPEQTRLAGGILDLRLVEGGLAAAEGGEAVTIEFAGGKSRGLSEDYVRRRFPSARRRPLSAYGVERDFRLLAESAAVRTVNVDLRPSGRAGEASLHVLVEPESRANLYFGYANDRSPSVGGERAYAGGYLRNMVASGDLLALELGHTSGVEDGQLSYATPFLSPRTTLSLRGSFNDAAVIDPPLLPLDISARDRAVEGGLVHRFIEEPLRPAATAGRWSPSRTLSAGLLLAYRHQRSYLFGQPFSFAPGSENGRSRYGALRFTGDYVLRSVDQVLALSATATVGLSGTRSKTPGILNPDANFLVGLVQANYARRLGPPGLELRARLAGQLASSILYSGERLSIGGQGSVRGYRENLFLVDEGAIGSVELGWSVSLAGKEGRRAVDWGAFSLSAFADSAVARNKKAPPPARGFVASVGAGVAWTPSEALHLSVSYGHALREVPRAGTRDLQDRGLHFRATVEPLRLLAALRRKR